MIHFPAELLVSFWDISLDNFPEGDLRHRVIPNDEAASLINSVKNNGQAFFGSDADIGAPYRKRELRKTKELISVLSSHWGIDIEINDFFTEFEDGMSCTVPITMYDIRPDRPLLVTTCSYTVDRKPTADDLSTSVAPDSVKFHLFELITRDET